MKYIVFLMLSLSVCFTGWAQNAYFYVTGTVYSAETNLPLQAASVFAQNSTLGTATDAQGNFNLGLPQGGYDLVVTFSGMESESIRVSSSENHSNLIFKLKQNNKDMQEVAIVATTEVKDGYAKYGEFFLNEFIGQSVNSSQTIITNPEILKFYFSRKRNRLKIMAAEPLQIENKALGYKITYALDSFTHYYNTHTSLYTGYPLFTEMETASEPQMQQWQQSRKKAYYGSILHFMRALYHKELKQEGFEVQFLINNKAQAVAVKNPYVSLQYQKDDSLNLVKFIPVQSNLGVIYKKQQPSASYTAAYPAEPKDFQFSLLVFKPAETINIEQNGYYYEQNDVALSGYWEWQKVADMLPFNYSTETAMAPPPPIAMVAPENNASTGIEESSPVKTTENISINVAEPLPSAVSSSTTIAQEPIAQNEMAACLQAEAEKISTLIKKSIAIDAMQYKNKIAEEFTIEINLPKQPTDEMVFDFFRKSSSVHYPQIEIAIKKLKESLAADNFCSYHRLIIPVTIYFDDADKPDAFIKERFENNAANKTYILKPIAVKVYSRVE